MINFFRKTRKKMADDNRPLKYMRYAIGEIALVVIGILIAIGGLLVLISYLILESTKH